MTLHPPFGRIILPFILVGTLGIPFKRMIDLDISGMIPGQVESIPSKARPNGTHYTIKKYLVNVRVVGNVTDADQLILPADPMAATRYVLVQPRYNGMTYVRVITRWAIAKNKYGTRVEEFVKRPTDLYYMQIFRTPVELNLLTQQSDQNINVEILPHQTGLRQETLPTSYSIKPHLWLTHTIGVVRFGHVILDKVDGLMSREVLWEGMIGEPLVTVTSRYTDGRWTETKYKMQNGQEFKLVDYRNKPVELRE